MIDELAIEIKNKRVILFVGAGVSKNLGLPDWEDLINHIAKELGYDPSIFNILGNNNYLELAEFYKLTKGSIGPLRSWMDVEWDKGKEKIENSKIHENIVKLNFPIIYTTNYDRMLEYSYQKFAPSKEVSRVVDIEDLKDINGDKTQIIKFHGDFDKDESLVLAESDYFRRLSFENPLDIKFRSDMLGKSVLFIGYGLNDLNIRYMLFKLNELWRNTIKDSKRPKLYLFNNSINEVQEKILNARGVQVISNKEDHPGKALQRFLSQLLEQ